MISDLLNERYSEIFLRRASWVFNDAMQNEILGIFLIINLALE